jgi:DNA-binding GntR family transcriptional regulator
MPNDTDAEQAYQRLRNMIIRTELVPGASVVDTELSELTGFGRTPLRDALHRLVHDGLVVIRPRRGTFVSEVTVSDLQQVFEVRAALEEMVARLAVDRASAQDLAELDAMIDRQRFTSSDDESDVSLDGELHRLLVRVCANRYLSEMYERMANSSLRLLYLTRCGMESREEQAHFLREVRRALAGRDGEGLRVALVAHVADFRERVGSSIMGGLAVGHSAR